MILDQRWENMLKAFDEWTIYLKKGLPKNRKNYKRAFKITQHVLDAPEEKDLYDLVKKVNQLVKSPDIRSKGGKLLKAIKSTVINEWHTRDYPGANGISISVVSPRASDYKYYKNLDLNLTTNWNEFLDAFRP